jgi:hypothetical protein
MIIFSAEVLTSPAVNRFISKTKNRMISSKIHSGLHFGMVFKSLKFRDKTFICFGYELIGESILKYAAFILAVVFTFFEFYKSLIIPIIFFMIPSILIFLGFIMLDRGLRKEGYKGKVKLISSSDFIKGGVLNVTK